MAANIQYAFLIKLLQYRQVPQYWRQRKGAIVDVDELKQGLQ